MSDRTWHKGPPPHVGWWNASRIRSTCIWRWWNGSVWSLEAYEISSVKYAAACARRMTFDQHEIEWTHYWPKNARVRRIDPRKVQAC